jgi:chromosome segregation ATPase
LVLLATGALAVEERAAANPLGKVIELLDSCAAKLVKDGEAEDKAFNTYVEWCDDTTKEQQFVIKTATTKVKELKATIDKAASDIEATEGKIEDLAGKIAKAEGEKKDATLVREKEAKEFEEAESELVDTVDAVTRAIGIIEKEMAKNPAAFMQVDASSITNLVGALSSIVDAAGVATADKKTLVAFVQAQEQSDDEETGAPDPAAYKSHSSGIMDVLEDLKAKAEKELSDLRKAESNTKHNFNMLEQSLEDEIAYNTKEKTEEQDFLSETEATKATATGDLATTSKLLAETEKDLKTTQDDCMKTASDHDASTAARAEEMKVVAEAKKILQDTSAGAVDEAYSFAQVSSLRTKVDMKGAEVTRFVRTLARNQHSAALSQLASRIAALMQFGRRNGEDPFVKVKGLIKDMIEKLEREADAAATEKAYCDEQMAKTESKKSELEDDVAKLTSKIDTKSAASAKLKEEVKVLQEELAAMAKEQSQMDKVRAEQHAAYVDAKADLELGLTGVSKALQVLRKYYQGDGAAALLQGAEGQPAKPVFHSKASGAGGGIIDILEVVESDFAKALETEETMESDAKAAYDERTQEIKVSTAENTKDVEFKTQESKNLDKEVNELSADRESTQSELDAVNEYYAEVKDRCIAKPETYEERKARREAEIAGLKEALQILSEETAPAVLLQARNRHSTRHQTLSP